MKKVSLNFLKCSQKHQIRLDQVKKKSESVRKELKLAKQVYQQKRICNNPKVKLFKYW